VTATATAQNVSGSIQSAGGAPVIQQVPAGTPLVGRGIQLVQTSGGLVMAILNGSLSATDTKIELLLNETLMARGQATAALQGDVLLTVSAPLPFRVRVELDCTAGILAGTPVPQVAADIGNDGSVDLNGAVNRVVSTLVTIGSSNQIMLRTSGSVSGAVVNQQVTMQVRLRVLPDAEGIQTLPMLPACGSGFQLTAEETFAPGLRLRHSLFNPTAAFLVAGFGTGFLPVPGIPNCFLVPNPGAVVLMPAPTFAIPASLGPAAFYLQSVALPTPTSPSMVVSNSMLVLLQ
jgi:hypothetical protein